MGWFCVFHERIFYFSEIFSLTSYLSQTFDWAVFTYSWFILKKITVKVLAKATKSFKKNRRISRRLGYVDSKKRIIFPRRRANSIALVLTVQGPSPLGVSQTATIDPTCAANTSLASSWSSQVVPCRECGHNSHHVSFSRCCFSQCHQY